jgi:integrase
MRTPEPFTTHYRADTQKFQFTLNPACGLPPRVCLEWRRRSFLSLPDDLANYRNPKTNKAAQAGVKALVTYLIKKQAEEGSARRVSVEDITVGAWIEKFTELDTSPRTGINASKNRPFSYDTLDSYKSYYRLHIKDDPICGLKMSEIEEEDILEFITRLSVSKCKDGSNRQMGGTRKFVLVVSFMRTAFNSYQRKNKRQNNPFQYIDKPTYHKTIRDALTEDEVVKLFMPGVLTDTLELAVCAAMFLSGLRRAEVSALRPEDLDWTTSRIMISRSWQRFNSKNKVMGPTKGKRARKAPFDPILQGAIKKLWADNGEHEFVFSVMRKNKTVKTVGSAWIKGRFPKWLERAGIELGKRKIVPHSSRHSLASMLEARGVSLRYIQELLGHSDLKTTKIYLHSPEKTLKVISDIISGAVESKPEPEEVKVMPFKVS